MYGFFLYQFWHVLRGVTTNETFKWDSTRAKQREQFKYAFHCFQNKSVQKIWAKWETGPAEKYLQSGSHSECFKCYFPPFFVLKAALRGSTKETGQV